MSLIKQELQRLEQQSIVSSGRELHFDALNQLFVLLQISMVDGRMPPEKRNGMR